jgi:hypothetical protein
MHVRRIRNTVVSRIEASTTTHVFSIVNATGPAYDALNTVFPDLPSWPAPRVVLTPRGAFAGDPFDASDAVLYLAPPNRMTLSKVSSALCTDVDYLRMLRERMRWARMPEQTARELLARDCPDADSR